MKQVGIALMFVVGIAAGAFALFMVDIDQTKEARLPSVDLEVTGGQAPEWEATTGNIEITEEKTTVPVPEVEIKQKEITVPGLKITPPEDAGTGQDAQD